MERLTTRYTDHAALKLAKDIGEWCISHDPQKDDYSIYGDAVERLAAYEDTGLTPEEIIKALKTLDLFVEATKGIPLNRIREFVQAEQDGRLVVLPAKKVFELTYDAGKNCDMRCDIDAVERCDLCKKGELVIYEVACKQEHIDKIGKFVFLTREEAEAALKGGAE